MRNDTVVSSLQKQSGYEKGLEKGEDGMFSAATPCTRGYVITYLYRYMTGRELAN
ncbi:MAG: hypothetical protein J5789_00640 [Oscillospiraceae bacterium]|nr:hypothetical protein [Oscillospiraceae bacterium]